MADQDLTPDPDGVLGLDLETLPATIEVPNPNNPADLVIYVPIRSMTYDSQSKAEMHEVYAAVAEHLTKENTP